MRLFTDAQAAFAREHARGRMNRELTDLINAKYGTAFTVAQVRNWKSNNKVWSGLSRQEINDKSIWPKLFTDEQEAFLVENYHGISNKELHELLTEKYGSVATLVQVKSFKQRHRLDSGLKGTEGIAPPNKGKRCPGQRNRGNYQKGHVPASKVAVGTTRVNAEGYAEKKVADPDKWRPMHLIEWESYNGGVPKDCVVVFKDQDRSNYRIENLEMITRAQLLQMNRHGLFHDDAELTATGISIAKLIDKAHRRQKE